MNSIRRQPGSTYYAEGGVVAARKRALSQFAKRNPRDLQK